MRGSGEGHERPVDRSCHAYLSYMSIDPGRAGALVKDLCS